MGNFITIFDKNQIIELKIMDGNKNEDSNNHEYLREYKNFLIKYGYYSVNINLDLLRVKLKDLFKKADFLNKKGKVPKDYKIIRNFIKNKKADKASLIVMYMFLGMASSYGFFSIGHYSKNINYEDLINNVENVDKLLSTKIIIPKILFKNNKDFINLISDEFIDKKEFGSPEFKKMLKSLVSNLFKDFSNVKEADIKFANTVNLLFELTLGLTLSDIVYRNNDYDSEKMNAIVFQILGKFFNYIKDDSCVNNESPLVIHPNVCKRKRKQEKDNLTCPDCPDCPDCPSCPDSKKPDSEKPDCPSCPPVVAPSCPPVVAPTCPPVEKPTCPPVEKPICPPVVAPTCPPVVAPTCPPPTVCPKCNNNSILPIISDNKNIPKFAKVNSEEIFQVNSETNITELLKKYDLHLKVVGVIFFLYLVWIIYRYLVPAEED